MDRQTEGAAFSRGLPTFINSAFEHRKSNGNQRRLVDYNLLFTVCFLFSRFESVLNSTRLNRFIFNRFRIYVDYMHSTDCLTLYHHEGRQTEKLHWRGWQKSIQPQYTHSFEDTLHYTFWNLMQCLSTSTHRSDRFKCLSISILSGFTFNLYFHQYTKYTVGKMYLTFDYLAQFFHL